MNKTLFEISKLLDTKKNIGANEALSMLNKAKTEIERLDDLINTPHIKDFTEAVNLEAIHQRERWGAEHDHGKAPEDWFWLVGYLAGKALHALKQGDMRKAKHHTISTSAVLNNWHSAIDGNHSTFRPGISKEKAKAVTP